MGDEFQIGFWQTLTPQGTESVESIIERKLWDIAENGWTLWSFRHLRAETLRAWHQELLASAPDKVLVLCSQGKPATELGSNSTEMTNYRFIDEDDWQP